MTTPMPITLRHGTDRDVDFVFSSWLRSFLKHRQKVLFPVTLTDAEYYRGHHRLIEAVLGRANVLVACDPGDENHLYGYVCFERPEPARLVLHWLYVKEARRGWKVGTRLVEAVRQPGDRVIATHWTGRLKNDNADVKYQVEVNPYYLWSEAA
jgi:GNAT superfamily N-acetyltransferase